MTDKIKHTGDFWLRLDNAAKNSQSISYSVWLKRVPRFDVLTAMVPVDEIMPVLVVYS